MHQGLCLSDTRQRILPVSDCVLVADLSRHFRTTGWSCGDNILCGSFLLSASGYNDNQVKGIGVLQTCANNAPFKVQGALHYYANSGLRVVDGLVVERRR